jgi:hypothetical protein
MQCFSSQNNKNRIVFVDRSGSMLLITYDIVNIKTLHFKKDLHEKWHILLPDWRGSPDELEMVSGADTWLDIVSDDKDECVVYMSEEAFEGAHPIKLITERLPEQGGGGNYVLEVYNMEIIDLEIWLCEVTRWLWGKLPEVIYFRVK